MIAGLERWLQRRWYGGEPAGLGLRAVAGLYRVVSKARRAEPVRVGAPVLVVGNFTAGGTGKTPLVIALARHFAARGWRPGVVSRGHGRLARGPTVVARDSRASDVGDEPLLIHRRAGVPVFVDADRVAAARAAIAAGCDVIIADDGLQHHRLARDIEIEVVDAARGYGNGLWLPAGPLREAPRRVDFRVATGTASTDAASAQGAASMTLQLAAEAQPVGHPAPPRPLASFVGASVQAIAGIGHPERFFDALREAGLAVDGHAFPDHHAYAADELARLPRPLLMTEKDAVKCQDFPLHEAWSVGVDAVLPTGFLEAVEARLQAIGHG